MTLVVLCLIWYTYCVPRFYLCMLRAGFLFCDALCGMHVVWPSLCDACCVTLFVGRLLSEACCDMHGSVCLLFNADAFCVMVIIALYHMLILICLLCDWYCWTLATGWLLCYACCWMYGMWRLLLDGCCVMLAISRLLWDSSCWSLPVRRILCDAWCVILSIGC